MTNVFNYGKYMFYRQDIAGNTKDRIGRHFRAIRKIMTSEKWENLKKIYEKTNDIGLIGTLVSGLYSQLGYSPSTVIRVVRQFKTFFVWQMENNSVA
jgi:site-specific recombinase XerD